MLTAIRSNLLHNVDCDLRVIILSANGGVFSSGHDLKELVRQLQGWLVWLWDEQLPLIVARAVYDNRNIVFKSR